MQTGIRDLTVAPYLDSDPTTGSVILHADQWFADEVTTSTFNKNICQNLLKYKIIQSIRWTPIRMCQLRVG